MKRIFSFLLIFTSIFTLAACGGNDTPTDGTEQPVEPEEKAPFRIEVLDITATSARVSVFPTDKGTKYYFDLLRAEYYNEYNEKYGFQRFIDNTVNRLAENNSMTKEQVLARILSAGDDSYGFTNLDADTEYYALAMGIDNQGVITTEIVSTNFKTEAAKQSDNRFTITLGTPSYDGVTYTVTPSNSTEKYVLIAWNKPTVDNKGDNFPAYCIKSRSDIESYIVSGEQKGFWKDCVPGRDYYLVAFGYEGGLATTKPVLAAFTTRSGSNPAECNFTFTVSDIEYDRVYMKVEPSKKYTPFFWSVVERTYYDALVKNVGTEKAMESVLAESLTPFEQDFGNIYDALDIITSYGDVNVEGTTYGLTQGTEYIPWAVAIDNNGKAIAQFVMGESFTTKSDTISDCTITVKGSYHTGSDGLAVVESVATPDSKCVGFYNTMFMGDVSTASRQTLLNNLIRDNYYKNLSVCSFDKCVWGQPVTAAAVGFDADGNFGEIATDVFTPKKE